MLHSFNNILFRYKIDRPYSHLHHPTPNPLKPPQAALAVFSQKPVPYNRYILSMFCTKQIHGLMSTLSIQYLLKIKPFSIASLYETTS